MGKPLALQCDDSSRATAELPYRIELWDAGGGQPVRLLALSSSAGVGYAAYYAAVREYFGLRVTLRREQRLLAASGATEA